MPAAQPSGSRPTVVEQAATAYRGLLVGAALYVVAIISVGLQSAQGPSPVPPATPQAPVRGPDMRDPWRNFGPVAPLPPPEPPVPVPQPRSAPLSPGASLGWLLATVALSWSAYRLASLLGRPAPWLWVPGMIAPIPFLPLVLAMVLGDAARAWFAEAGIPCGPMGPSRAELKSPAPETSVSPPPATHHAQTPRQAAADYVRQMRELGYDDEQIIAALVRSDWSSEDARDMVTLTPASSAASSPEQFVRECLALGMSYPQITEELVRSGWTREDAAALIASVRD